LRSKNKHLVFVIVDAGVSVARKIVACVENSLAGRGLLRRFINHTMTPQIT